MLAIVMALHLIGVQPWCTVDKNTKQTQCNYESKGACEAYRQDSEHCIQNPNLKKAKHEGLLKKKHSSMS